MKKLFQIIAIAIIGLTLATSCNSEERKIKKISEQFLTAFDNGDFTTCKSLATEESALELEHIEYYLKMLGVNSDSITSNTKFNFTKVEINGDEAIAYYTAEIPNEEGSAEVEDEELPESTLALKKVNGEWRVDYKKEGPTNEEIDDEPMDEMDFDDSISIIDDKGILADEPDETVTDEKF